MTSRHERFTGWQRLLHWLMAILGHAPGSPEVIDG